jgi:hypothetical protein
MNVVWFKVDNSIFLGYRVAYLDQNTEAMGVFTCGLRNLNEIIHDGIGSDSNCDIYGSCSMIWCLIRLTRSGIIAVYSDITQGNNCIYGIAFGINLCNHAKNSAFAYSLNVNRVPEVTNQIFLQFFIYIAVK